MDKLTIKNDLIRLKELSQKNQSNPVIFDQIYDICSELVSLNIMDTFGDFIDDNKDKRQLIDQYYYNL
ncbi:MAG: hypothetical protein KGY70_11520 [Bacteroidales bacterium]|nr:hypothetical protein [Bacteroidales bacterium]